MPDSLEEIVEATGKSEAEIYRKGGEAFVDRQLRDARIRTDKFREIFGVDTPAELAGLIEHGEVSEHLAADELQEWKELTIRIKHLEQI